MDPLRAEVLSLAVRHLADLPRPTTLLVAIPQVDLFARVERAALTTSRARYVQLAHAGAAVFSPTEYEAILAAAEAGVAYPATFAAWCRRKLDEPGFRLTPAIALAGRPAVPPPRDFWWDGAGGGAGDWLVHGWTFERLFHHLGVELVDVALEEREARAA